MNSNETLSAVKDVKTGEVYREADQIFQYLLEYNEENMSKDVIDNEEVRVIRDLKIEAIEMMFEESGDLPQTIPWQVYCKVVIRILEQKKNVFNDFIKSGTLFKLAIFNLLDKIYISEKIPESMRKTVLTKIYEKRDQLKILKITGSFMGKDGQIRSWKSAWLK